MNSTSTASLPICTGSLIIPLGVTILPLNPTNGESYLLKSSGFKFNLLYKSGYMISALLPSSTNNLFTPYLPIWKVTTRASSWGWKVPTLSLSEKPKVSYTFAITFLDSRTCSFSSDLNAMDMILEEGPTSWLGVTRITLMVPNDGHGTASHWYPFPT